MVTLGTSRDLIKEYECEKSACKFPMSLTFLNSSYPVKIDSAFRLSEMHSWIDECSIDEELKWLAAVYKTY